MWFLIIYPDGHSEVVQLYYVCTGVPTNVNIVFGKHECPKAGIMYKNGEFYLLVSKKCVKGLGNIKIKRVDDWITMLIAPSNTSLSNPKILYKLIYIGRSFLASSRLPPTWCEVLVTNPQGRKVVLLDRGLCPWIRINNTYITPGYTYEHWIDLTSIVHVPGNYSVKTHVSCTIKMIEHAKDTIKYVHFNTTLTMNLELK